jgi:hypothetical protein
MMHEPDALCDPRSLFQQCERRADDVAFQTRRRDHRDDCPDVYDAIEVLLRQLDALMAHLPAACAAQSERRDT